MHIKKEGDFQTEYVTSSVPTNVAKIMSFNKTLPNSNNVSSQFNRIQFRVMHGLGTNMIVKEYFIYADVNGITFVDLTPLESSKIEVFIAATGTNEYGVFFKAGLTYAKTHIQITHALVESFFTFYDYAKFDTNPSTLTKISAMNNSADSIALAKTDLAFTYSSNWVDFDSTQFKNKTGLSAIGKQVQLTCHAKSGTITDNTVLLQITDPKYYPTKNIFGYIVNYTGSTCVTNGSYLINTSGSVMLFGVTSNSRVSFNESWFTA
ncbi:MAG: hypothetical protein Q8936_16735 [Bacillota bacterium]|nr:hypothetical protein [Bacillota bacterium]